MLVHGLTAMPRPATSPGSHDSCELTFPTQKGVGAADGVDVGVDDVGVVDGIPEGSAVGTEVDGETVGLQVVPSLQQVNAHNSLRTKLPTFTQH